MLSLVEFFADLTNPALAFLPKALGAAVLSALLCAVVGCFVVLRGMAFIGDAVAHAVFPGLAIAFALQTSLLLGGAVAGIAVAVIVALFAHHRKLAEDSAIGIFFAAAFAVGLVVLSRTHGYTATLTSFLFGSITGVSSADLWLIGGTTVVAIAVILALFRPLVACSLDKETARALGLPTMLLDVALYIIVAAAVVISVRTVGNILVLALLVTPAATARMFCNSLPRMMVVAAMLGMGSAIVGVYLSWAVDAPTGATIVLVATTLFIATTAVTAVRR